MPTEIPAFRMQDDLAWADGRPASAHNLRRLYGNLDHMAAKLCGCLLQQAWDVKSGLTYLRSPVGPEPIVLHRAAWMPPDFTYARLRIRANVENTKSAFLDAQTGARGVQVGSSGGAFELIGDGTMKRYPTSGTWLVRLSPGLNFVSVFLRSIGAQIAVKEKLDTGLTTGTIDATGMGWIEDTASDFSGMDYTADTYLYTFADSGGTQRRTGPYRIIGAATGGAVGSICKFRYMRGPQPRVQEYWRMFRGTKVTLANVSLYEQSLTSLG